MDLLGQIACDHRVADLVAGFQKSAGTGSTEEEKAKAAKEADAGMEEPDANAPRMRQRRGTMPPVMAMTAQAAAQSIDPKRLAELMGEAPAKPKKKTNTKDVKKGKK